jgi:hypothetical protein
VWPFLFDSQEGLEDLVVEVEREGGASTEVSPVYSYAFIFYTKKVGCVPIFYRNIIGFFNSQKGLEDLVVEEQRGKFVCTKVRHVHLRFLGLCVSRGSG